jgi:hypothetical protein
VRQSQYRGRRLVGAISAVAGGFVTGQTAEAVVVFQDFAPPLEVDPTEHFIDLDNDGVREFRIGVAIDGDFTDLGIKADTFAGRESRPGMAGLIIDPLNNSAANLAAGTLIGPTDVFVTPFLTRLNGDTDDSSFQPAGNFNSDPVLVDPGYIAVQFERNGNTHYGYVAYEGDAGLGGNGRIHKIGYEDTPLLGIAAGSETSIPANVGVPGDFDGSGSVDAADYVVWAKKLGNLQSFNVWRSNYGNPSGSGAAVGQSLSTGNVPEPTSLALLAAGAAGLPWYRRRRTCERGSEKGN